MVTAKRMERHNFACQRLAVVAKRMGWEVYREKSFEDKTGVKRPDLVFCSEGKALVLDVTVRFELNANVLKKACRDKQKHYKSIVKQVEDSMGVTEVEVHGFPIGARGLWYRPNSKVLRKLGLSKPEARALAERLCKGALRGSLSVMREFLLYEE